MTIRTPQKDLDARGARSLAQRVAFGPLTFHSALALRDLGILQALLDASEEGATISELANDLQVPPYGLTVLLESGLGAGFVRKLGARFIATKAAYFIVHADMTRVNFNFVRDVCYRGAEDLIAAIEQGRPAGLHHLADADTVYEALPDLAEPARTSWFEFDHYYSSAAFPAVRPRVLRNKPKRLLDVGGNTGKWAVYLAQGAADMRVTIVDHANQLGLAALRAEERGVADRIDGVAMDLLDHSRPLPGPVDVVWMSQLLSCFSESDCVKLMVRAREALNEHGELLILENLWDRQRYDAAEFCLQQTSLYFTTIANGTSRIYSAEVLGRCLWEAGLQLIEDVDHIGAGHTFWRCRKLV